MKVISSSEHFQTPRVTQEALDDGAIRQASLPLNATLNLFDYRFPSLLVLIATGELSLGLLLDASSLSDIKTRMNIITAITSTHQLIFRDI